MNRTPRLMPPLVLAASLLPFAPLPAARAGDDPSEWAPKSALVYVGAPDCDALVAAYKKTSVWQLTQDPALKGTIQPWREVAKKLRDLAARKLGLDDPATLEVYPHGGLAFYVSSRPPAADDTEPQVDVALIMEMGENLPRMKKLTDAVVAKCLESGARKEIEEAAGGEVVILRFTQKGEAAEADTAVESGWVDEVMDILEGENVGLNAMALEGVRDALSEVEAPEEVAFAYRESKFVLSPEAVTVKAALKLLRDGGDDTFAASDALRLLKRKCEPRGQIDLAVNVPAIVALAARMDAEEAAPVMRALGLEALGPAVATFEYAPGDGIDSRGRGFFEIKDAKHGVGRLLMMANSSTAPPASVGGDAAVYGYANVSAATILEEVLAIAGRIDPADAEQMRAGLKVPQADGSVLDVQKDVLDHLTGPLFGTFTLTQPYEIDNINFLIGVGHKSRAAFDKLLAILPPGMLVPREMMGAVIYETPMMMGYAAAITDRVLIPAGTKGAVEAHIRAAGTEGGGLAEDPTFRRVAKFLPREACVGAYFDSRKVFDAQLAIHKRGTVTEQPPMFGMPMGAYLQWMLVQNFIGTKLEHPEALRKYQGSGMITVAATPDGLRLDAVGIVPGEQD